MTSRLLALTRASLLAVMAGVSGPAGAQEFSPGEEMVLSVSYLGVPTAEGRIRVGKPEGEIWPVIMQARTTGAASLLDIREHMVSYWDAGRRLSRGSDLQALEVGEFHADSARFDAGARKVTVVERYRGKKPKEKTLDVPDGALDVAGAFFWLRLQELDVGRRYELPVVAGTKQFTLSAEVLSREAVRTAAGEFPSFKIQVRTEFGGKFTTKRDSFLWLAEAAGHHLVRASADFAIGSVVAELKSYRPGDQVAAAEAPAQAIP